MDYGKLKTYYESIDGVTVPFVYPQFWDKDKEEWVVVDKDNRLPVDARLTGSIVEDESLAIRGRRVETYASDSSSFSIEVLPGSTYYADVLFKNGRIVGASGGDMRNYRKIAVGVQCGTGEHDYRLEVRARAIGTVTSINQLEVVDGSDKVKIIDIELLFHLVSVRIHNDSDEVQNYQLAVSAFPI